MSEHESGGVAQLPSIKVLFDPNTQQINLSFDAADFKDWHFVKAVLHGALSKADELCRMAQMQAMQQMALQQAQAQGQVQDLAKRLKMGRG